jgi:hypothetical protein
MRPLDLWVEYLYDNTGADAHLIDVDVDSNWMLRPIRYTLNDTDWNFYKYPTVDIYSYLTGLHNVMVF